MQLEMHCRQSAPGTTILALKGSLTLGSRLLEVERAVSDMIRQQRGNFVVDLLNVEMIDSAGVGMLLLCAGTSERTGAQMRIARPTARVRQILEITHLDEIVPILNDLDAALAGW